MAPMESTMALQQCYRKTWCCLTFALACRAMVSSCLDALDVDLLGSISPRSSINCLSPKISLSVSAHKSSHMVSLISHTT
ncbi:hypothetical protein P168DRAFT_111272 [Aspergillus campestris IBT 28561]|uniref:Uncharacterized protein n=1 Tax=Aspergillus campestris (strain IBT 28561) TaxID=1392248 RepID=A0A2I1D968_ASPC2|nr:uncharacterized protein P168DRAFT_111272 [Aspergillus campestris IBT 28561]PKY06409.1 hypothetical protein P168DRAFT_111272 [Aspergillus campestris IBT 28561]